MIGVVGCGVDATIRRQSAARPFAEPRANFLAHAHYTSLGVDFEQRGSIERDPMHITIRTNNTTPVFAISHESSSLA
jgi:hypothetical protein